MPDYSQRNCLFTIMMNQQDQLLKIERFIENQQSYNDQYRNHSSKNHLDKLTCQQYKLGKNKLKNHLTEACKSEAIFSIRSKTKTTLTNQQKCNLCKDIKRNIYSNDFIMKKYKINLQTLKKYLRQVNEYGSIEGKSKVYQKLNCKSRLIQPFVVEIITKQPFLTQQQLTKMVWDELNVQISQQTVSKLLSELGFTKKRRSNACTSINTEMIMELRQQFAKIYRNDLNENQLLFIDQIGYSELSERQFGYAPQGQRLTRQKKNIKYEQVTILLLMSYFKLYHWSVLPRPPNKDDILELFNKLDSQLKQWTLVLDNAAIHKSIQLKVAAYSKQIKIIYLPPSSQELNPTHIVFNQLKTIHRAQHSEDSKSIPKQEDGQCQNEITVDQMIRRANQCCKALQQSKFGNLKIQINHWIKKAMNRQQFHES